MIEIITDTGVSLDMSPEAEFEVEIENPIMTDDFIPAPFSTPIDLLPTPKNCRVFSWLPDTVFTTLIKTVKSSIVFNVLVLFSGKLVYDAVEDGLLKFTFSGSASTESLENMDISECVPGSHKIIDFAGLDNLVQGYDDVMQLPLIINEQNLANRVGKDDLLLYEKFHNYNPAYDSSFYTTPVLRVRHLIAGAFERLGMYLSEPTFLYNDYRYLSLICQYKPLVTDPETGRYDPDGDDSFSIVETLPKMSALDLIVNVAKLFCCAVFRVGNAFCIRPISSTVRQSTQISWDDKVADGFTLGMEPRQKYKFGYGNDSSECTISYAQIQNSIGPGVDDVKEVFTYKDLFDKMSGNTSATVCLRLSSQDDIETHCFSGFWESDSKRGEFVFDQIYRPIAAVENPLEEEEDVDTIDKSVDFSLAKCIPLVDQLEYKTDPTHNHAWHAAVIPIPSVGSERGSEAFVGLVDRQGYGGSYTKYIITDNGHYFNNLHTESQLADADLSPAAMFEKYHRPYAEWLGKDRVTVSADLCLTAADIHNLDLSSKVHFRGKRWLIKKLSVTLSAGSDVLMCSGEFIEC